jgi:hypothetical protein
MSATPRALTLLTAVLAALSLGACAQLAPTAGAHGLTDDGGAYWQLEQPPPPGAPAGVSESSTPIGVGPIGDIEFWAPNRGVLITAGNGSTIPPGLWAYNGEEWHELAKVCGATDGRIAWAGPEEFWTVSDGRPGQTDEANGTAPPLEDDTLCRFALPPGSAPATAGLEVRTSYASPAFQSSSYQPMQAAGCIGPSDCWFAGGSLPEPQVGAFQLHWNGETLTEEPSPQGHAVEDMRLYGGRLYESLRIAANDKLTDPEPSPPPILRRINPEGVQPTFVPLTPGVPTYASKELPEALDYLRLGADAESLWGAAGPAPNAPANSTPAQLTVVRYANGAWSQVLGPVEPPLVNPFAEEVVSSIAAEPGSESAWIALEPEKESLARSPVATAIVARVSADGTVSDEQTLPSSEEIEAGVGPKGSAKQIACTAPHECWLTTTQGWLFHLSLHTDDGHELPLDSDPAFAGLIASRPADEGLPQVAPTAPPLDDSGLNEEKPVKEPLLTEEKQPAAPLMKAALLSHERTRLVHRDTLELRFHLAVKARVRLLAQRHKKVVASTSTRTLGAGTHSLLLRLDPRRWPTKLDLQTRALAPLPDVSGESSSGESPGAGPNTVTTSAAFPEMRSTPEVELLR